MSPTDAAVAVGAGLLFSINLALWRIAGALSAMDTRQIVNDMKPAHRGRYNRRNDKRPPVDLSEWEPEDWENER